MKELNKIMNEVVKEVNSDFRKKKLTEDKLKKEVEKGQRAIIIKLVNPRFETFSAYPEGSEFVNPDFIAKTLFVSTKEVEDKRHKYLRKLTPMDTLQVLSRKKRMDAEIKSYNSFLKRKFKQYEHTKLKWEVD